MPTISITVTDEEATILKSFFDTAETGVKEIVRARVVNLAGLVVRESTSKFDPNKLNVVELKSEISKLTIAKEIPTYSERFPSNSHISLEEAKGKSDA